MKNNNIKISISSKNIKNCNEIAHFMKNLGIISSISPFLSVSDSIYGHHIVNGCKIHYKSENINNIKPLWLKLKNNFEINSAHLNIDNIYNGPINNFLNKTI